MTNKVLIIAVCVFLNVFPVWAQNKGLMDFEKDDKLFSELGIPEDIVNSQPKAGGIEPVQVKSQENINEYKVGVDDILDIQVIKPEQITSTVTVSPDGSITFPYIGSVHVKGMTLGYIQEEIQKSLAAGYMEFPIVSVSLRLTRSKKLTIYGQVLRPGGYPVEENMTLLRAITDAGGFIVPGSLGRVKVLRPKEGEKSPQVIELDIRAILKGEKENVNVLAGDTIVVNVDKFFIYGQVMKPGAYPVEDSMTILNAVTQAGGFIESGSKGKIKLFRAKKDGKKQHVIEADMKVILRGELPNTVVMPGDTIVVSLDKFFISGQVNRPGAYPVEEGMTLLNAVTQAGGFVDSNSTGLIKLVRAQKGSERSQIIEAGVTETLNGTYQNVFVEPGDSIVVSSDRFSVYGEVNRPGVYPLDANTTTLTAITMSGGFTKFGAANRVKVLRVNEATGEYETIKVNINDVMSGNLKADVKLEPRDVVIVSEGMF